MRFDRFPVRQKGQRERSPQRVTAARQAVRRELDAVPLFPELARWKTPDERMAAMDTESAERIQHFRDWQARSWRRARAELKRLRPTQAAGVLAYWRAGIIPASPSYLLSLMHDTRAKHVCHWHKLAFLRRLRLFALGRGPRPPLED